MNGYTRLFSDIITSTIWREPNHVRIVWITMLALKDRRHEIRASVPGLADASRVTIEECVQALEKLKSPDPWSRTPDFEGRRIEEISGGWRILNGEKYSRLVALDERREYKASKQREYRNKPSKEELFHNLPEKEVEKADPLSDFRKDAAQVLGFLNQKTGKRYRPVDINLQFIMCRLKEGATVQDMKSVIAKKVRDWGADERMAPYLRPKTLFNKTNFAQYTGEIKGEQDELPGM